MSSAKNKESTDTKTIQETKTDMPDNQTVKTDIQTPNSLTPQLRTARLASDRPRRFTEIQYTRCKTGMKAAGICHICRMNKIDQKISKQLCIECFIKAKKI